MSASQALWANDACKENEALVGGDKGLGIGSPLVAGGVGGPAVMQV